MPQCYVQNCGNYYSKTRKLKSTDSSVMYHVFPSSRHQALLWASLARGEDVTKIPTNGRICSWHFSDKNYQRDLQHELLGLPKRKKLIPNAVPDTLLPPENKGNNVDKLYFYKKCNKKNSVNNKNPKKARKKKTAPPPFQEFLIKQELLNPSEDLSTINNLFASDLSSSLGLLNYIKTEPYDSETNELTDTNTNNTEGFNNLNYNKNLIKSENIKAESDIDVKMEPLDSSDKNLQPLLNDNSMDDKKRKNGVRVKSEFSKKSISYPIRSSIRIAKKKSLLAENQMRDIAFTPKEKTGRDSFAFKIKYMAKLNLEYNTDGKKPANRMLVMEEADDVTSNNLSNSASLLPENKENNLEEKILNTEESKENADKNHDFNDEISEEKAENLTITKSEIMIPKTENIEIDEEVIEKDNDSKRSLEEQDESLSKKPRLNEISDKQEEADFSKCDTLQDIDALEIKLLTDIECLDQLARIKEREWNSIIHAKKIKEEQMLRVQRKKQVTLLSRANPNSDVDWELALDIHIKSLNDIQNNITRNNFLDSRIPITITDNGVTIQPIPPTNRKLSKLSDGRNRNNRQLINERSLLNPFNRQRNILPKPQQMFAEYSSNGSLKTGPKGQPIMDVNLIVEKFRQSNPEVPRRGKRIRTVQKNETDAVSSTSKMLPLLSLNKSISHGNVPLMPNKVDVNSELGMLLSSGSETARGRDLQNDSSRSSDSLPEGNSGNVSFKDVLVEFARMSQTERRGTTSEPSNNVRQMDSYNIGGKNATSCPEVTLHPVVLNERSSTATVSNSQSTLTSNSLLHGILTKNKPKSITKPFTTLSPTLARLLTDTSSQPSDVSNINDLLANSQNRGVTTSPSRYNETTIHSIDPALNLNRTSTSITSNVQYSESSTGIVNLDDIENEDSLDRLVIDETSEGTSSKTKTGNDTGGEKEPSQIPPCQGCKKNSAQFVCAGCTSQWYCSRECQVSDWDQHCEICSG